MGPMSAFQCSTRPIHAESTGASPSSTWIMRWRFSTTACFTGSTTMSTTASQAPCAPAIITDAPSMRSSITLWLCPPSHASTPRMPRASRATSPWARRVESVSPGMCPTATTIAAPALRRRGTLGAAAAESSPKRRCATCDASVTRGVPG